jgi:hypothetical protein
MVCGSDETLTEALFQCMLVDEVYQSGVKHHLHTASAMHNLLIGGTVGYRRYCALVCPDWQIYADDIGFTHWAVIPAIQAICSPRGIGKPFANTESSAFPPPRQRRAIGDGIEYWGNSLTVDGQVVGYANVVPWTGYQRLDQQWKLTCGSPTTGIVLNGCRRRKHNELTDRRFVQDVPDVKPRRHALSVVPREQRIFRRHEDRDQKHQLGRYYRLKNG